METQFCAVVHHPLRSSGITGGFCFVCRSGWFLSSPWVIPPHLLVTNLKPDLFLVNESARVAVLVELTCPWDKNILRSHEYKREKYAPLVGDLSRDLNVFYFPIEVSVRGQISKGNRARFKSFVFRCCLDPIGRYCRQC